MEGPSYMTSDDGHTSETLFVVDGFGDMKVEHHGDDGEDSTSGEEEEDGEEDGEAKVGCVLDIFDTASQGEAEYSSTCLKYIQESNSIMLVYGIDSRASFERLASIRENILIVRKGVLPHIIIVANKADLEDARQVSRQEGEKLAAQWHADFIEVSAKTANNIEQAFSIVLRTFLHEYELECKIILLGAGGVGKSSICRQFADDTFDEDCNPTSEKTHRKMLVQSIETTSKFLKSGEDMEQMPHSSPPSKIRSLFSGFIDSVFSRKQYSSLGVDDGFKW